MNSNKMKEESKPWIKHLIILAIFVCIFVKDFTQFNKLTVQSFLPEQMVGNVENSMSSAEETSGFVEKTRATGSGRTALSTTTYSLKAEVEEKKKITMDDVVQNQQNEVKKEKNAMDSFVNGTRLPVMEGDREILYLHVGKTGGATLDKIFRSNCEYKSKKLRCLSELPEHESVLSHLTKYTVHVNWKKRRQFDSCCHDFQLDTIPLAFLQFLFAITQHFLTCS